MTPEELSELRARYESEYNCGAREADVLALLGEVDRLMVENRGLRNAVDDGIDERRALEKALGVNQ